MIRYFFSTQVCAVPYVDVELYAKRGKKGSAAHSFHACVCIRSLSLSLGDLPLLRPMEPSDAGSASQQASTSIDSVDTNVETMMNLALLDPPRWGWSAAGGVVDLLPPHEVSTAST